MIQVPVKGEAERPRNRRGSHHQQMWILAFADELLPLADAEFMLFIDDDQAKVFDVEASLNQGVGANHQRRARRTTAAKVSRVTSCFSASGLHFDGDPQFVKP